MTKQKTTESTNILQKKDDFEKLITIITNKMFSNMARYCLDIERAVRNFDKEILEILNRRK